jgi:hypothetical protein
MKTFCSKLTLTVLGALEETPTFFGVLGLDKKIVCFKSCVAELATEPGETQDSTSNHICGYVP